jgi:hypothetical protein
MRCRLYFAFTMLVLALACTRLCSAQTCTTSFATVDQSKLWTSYPCSCFDKSPRGTKIYLVDQYRIVEGNNTADLPPETIFSCEASALTYVRPGSTEREQVPRRAKVIYVRAAAEMAVNSYEAQIEMDHRLRSGTAVSERIR